MRPKYWKQATAELAARDPVMQGMIAQYREFALGSRGDAFQTLARAIVGQQISVKAAQSVWDRFAAAHSAVTPAVVAKSKTETLRACGLSGQKSSYILDLATRFDQGQLDPTRWKRLQDEALIEELTQVKGIGRWTAQMFMIFNLARPDVFPLADLGLQKALQLHYNRGRTLTPARMQRLGEKWAPWRSVATWYLWRSLDPIPVEY
ncbi:MAG: DNA-3-methyladenine glycosylase 2 family protein [Betaproteobacteria bacterium]|nr:DNA-3-methyladenine glycosylase 2 family protein [Betaproteobacteria bacterium]